MYELGPGVCHVRLSPPSTTSTAASEANAPGTWETGRGAADVGPVSGAVLAVAPGPVQTDLFMTGKSDAQVEAITKMNPLGRLGQPDDIASVVAFLASPDSGWINGQTIRANGGVV